VCNGISIRSWIDNGLEEHKMKEGFRDWLGIWARIFLGMVFIVAGAGKLLAGSQGFEPFVLPSFLPQALTESIYAGLPYIEILIGGLLILGIAMK